MSKPFNITDELHGIWRIIPSPAITEIIAQSGFNFQILDCEHGAYDYATLEADIRACDVSNCTAIVRVSGLNNVEVQRCLDLGAGGIIFPQLSNYEDFSRAAKLLRYAPEGVRGFNPFVRASGYGIPETYTKPLPVCIPIIETLQATDDLDRILSLTGIDAVYIGTYDLSAQLNCIGEMDNPKLMDLVDSIIAKCLTYGKPAGVMTGSPAQYNLYKGKGAGIFVHKVDSIQIKSTFVNIIEQYT